MSVMSVGAPCGRRFRFASVSCSGRSSGSVAVGLFTRNDVKNWLDKEVDFPAVIVGIVPSCLRRYWKMNSKTRVQHIECIMCSGDASQFLKRDGAATAMRILANENDMQYT